MNVLKLVAALVATTVLATPAFAADKTKAQQQNEVRATCKATLAKLYKAKPKLKAEVQKAEGYGCFSNFGVTVIVGGAGGTGLVHNNKDKTDVFMNMGQASAGIEVGVKDYREVLVFHNKEVMEKFINSGWEFSGSAGATATIAGKGGQDEKAGSIDNQAISIYPITKHGLALGASVGSRKYWKSDDLN